MTEKTLGVVDQCDDCGADLLYPGNRWGSETVCDGCYGRLEAMLR